MPVILSSPKNDQHRLCNYEWWKLLRLAQWWKVGFYSFVNHHRRRIWRRETGISDLVYLPRIRITGFTFMAIYDGESLPVTVVRSRIIVKDS